MKKSLLFVGLLMAMSLTVSAQNNGFAFGFKLGPGFDWTGLRGTTKPIVVSILVSANNSSVRPVVSARTTHCVMLGICL